MKYSQFNSIIQYKNKYALYNAYEQKVIFLDPALKEILNREEQTCIDNLKNIHPDFYNYLSENKFLIMNDVDEIEAVKNLVYSIDENKRIYDLTINPTINCNFRCWYCYETHIMKSQMDSSTLSKVSKHILNIAQNEEIEEFNLSFFGGEPLLYFKKIVIPIINEFVPLMKRFNKRFNIGFTTNGSLINDPFLNYFNEKQLKPNFHITLDGYRESHDKVRFVSPEKGSYLIIVNNIKKIVENEMFVRVRINFTDKNIEDTYKIADDLSIIKKEFSKKYLLIDFHRVWQNNQLDDIDIIVDRNVERIRKKGFNVKSSLYCNDTVRGSCYADKRNSAVINFNGDVFKCTAQDFKTENREGFLTDGGYIFWENNSLERRMKSKFNNNPCLECRLLPICNGACSRHALEGLGKHNFCAHSFDEREKDKVIKSMVDLIINENETA